MHAISSLGSYSRKGLVFDVGVETGVVCFIVISLGKPQQTEVGLLTGDPGKLKKARQREVTPGQSRSRIQKEKSSKGQVTTLTCFNCCALAAVKGLGGLHHGSECDWMCVALVLTETIEMLIREGSDSR